MKPRIRMVDGRWRVDYTYTSPYAWSFTRRCDLARLWCKNMNIIIARQQK